MRTFLTVFVRTRPCVPDKNHASFVSLFSSFTSPSRLRSCLRSVHALVRVRTMLACFACERGVTRRARGGPRDGGRRTHSFGPMEIYFLFFWKKCPKVSYCSSYNEVYHFPSFPNNLGHHLGKRRRTTSLRAKTRVKPSRAETGRHFTRTNEPREHEPEQMLAVSTTRVIVAAANTQRGGTRKVSAKKPAGKVRFLDANDSNRCDARCACGNREREEDRGTAIDRARSVTFRRGCAVRYGW